MHFLKNSLDKKFFYRILHWLNCDIELIKNSNVSNLNTHIPTLVIVANNEFEKIQMQISYYKKLGVEDIILIANNSSDAFINFVKKQDINFVYFVREKFSDEHKRAWIQRVLALHGFDRWYLVLDCDELFDYIGIESHSLEQFIASLEKQGLDRCFGFMLDMYSKDNLFDAHLKWNEIENNLIYFDSNSYLLDYCDAHYSDKKFTIIWGGFRQRIFGLRTLINKESLFKFSNETIYATHYIHPLCNNHLDRCYFVLKHYKFLSQDLQEYKKRSTQHNFAERGLHYRTYMNDKFKNCIPWNDESVMYEDSNSLSKLPFLKDCFK